MLISEAKPLVGQFVNLTYTDRSRKEYNETVEVFDVTFIPLYGPCLVTDLGDIRLDRIVFAERAVQQFKAA